MDSSLWLRNDTSFCSSFGREPRVIHVYLSATGVLVCWCEFGHWMCGESWYHQRSLTHHSQFSRLGIQCPTLIYVMFVYSGLVGGFLSIFFLIPVWLVCYAHGFMLCPTIQIMKVCHMALLVILGASPHY